MSIVAFKRFGSVTGEARIVVITTGGTIVQEFDKESGIWNFRKFSCPILNNEYFSYARWILTKD